MPKHARSKCEICLYFVQASALCYKTLAYLLSSQIIDKSKYKLGFDTKIKAGDFYKIPNLDFSYYCEFVGETQVKMWLIESYQNNGLFQGIGTLPLSNTTQFVEITEKTEIDRLRKMYEELKEKHKGNE